MDKIVSYGNFNQINFDKIESNILGEMKHILKSMVESLKFHLIYSQYVSKKQEQTTNKAVKEYRNKFWNAALKKTNGNKNKAYNLYTKNLKLLD